LLGIAVLPDGKRCTLLQAAPAMFAEEFGGRLGEHLQERVRFSQRGDRPLRLRELALESDDLLTQAARGTLAAMCLRQWFNSLARPQYLFRLRGLTAH